MVSTPITAETTYWFRYVLIICKQVIGLHMYHQATPTKPKKQVSEYEHGDTQAVSVKQEPRDVQSETLGPATGPSQALFDEWSHLRSQQQQHIGSGMC